MIIKGLFNLIYAFLNVVLTPFQILPNVPSLITVTTNNFITFIFAPVRILLYFVDPNMMRVAIPLVIMIINMEHIWDGILWVLKKLPFVGIE